MAEGWIRGAMVSDLGMRLAGSELALNLVHDNPASYDVDIYSDEVIAEPYDHYRAIRDAGPAVWLPRNGLWAVGRFADVRTVLMDHSRFSSARGIAGNELINSSSIGNTITSDPPEHTKMRRIIRAPLTAPALKDVAPRIEAEADALVERLVKQRSFDAIGDCARHLPVSIVSDLVGLPEEGRANMLRWAAATFDALGAMNARGEAALPHIRELHAYCRDPSTVARLRSDGWAAAIWKAAERGEIPEDKCPVMMRDYISPSLDTTIFATGSLIWFFGENPDQWNLVRRDPSLISAAINEAVRLESPIRGFTRVAVEDTVWDGAKLSAGSRILALYASANRDERKWREPEKFDVRREVRDHLGFGIGAHVCAGMHLARLEITALMTAFARRVSRFELGEPVRAVNNVLRGFVRLPVTVR
jgi:cytochrome P450